jgi:hypothetical protein
MTEIDNFVYRKMNINKRPFFNYYKKKGYSNSYDSDDESGD